MKKTLRLLDRESPSDQPCTNPSPNFLDNLKTNLSAIVLSCATLTVCLGARIAFAGEYKLVEGAGKQVCEAYRKNLEPRHDPEPMACARRYDPSIPGFLPPEWRKLDLNSNFELFRKAWIYLQENDNSPQGMKLSDKEIEQDATVHLKEMAQSTNVELFLATLDLVGDGKVHKVLAMKQDGCGPHPHRHPGNRITRIFILDAAGKNVDATVPEIWNAYSNATIEIFHGRAYLESYMADDNWGKLLTGSGSLSVLQFTSEATSQVCEITWTPDGADHGQDVKQ